MEPEYLKPLPWFLLGLVTYPAADLLLRLIRMIHEHRIIKGLKQ